MAPFALPPPLGAGARSVRDKGVHHGRNQPLLHLSLIHILEKAKHLLADLFDYYAAHIDEVPEDYRAISEGDDLRAVTDYIAGMTDRYATATYQRLFIPHALSY